MHTFQTAFVDELTKLAVDWAGLQNRLGNRMRRAAPLAAGGGFLLGGLGTTLGTMGELGAHLTGHPEAAEAMNALKWSGIGAGLGTATVGAGLQSLSERLQGAPQAPKAGG